MKTGRQWFPDPNNAALVDNWFDVPNLQRYQLLAQRNGHSLRLVECS